jgi:IPT/TIG domain
MSPVPCHFRRREISPLIALAFAALSIAVMLPSRANAQGINLSWDECGAAGSEIKSFACGVNTGEDIVVASFRPPSGINQFLGMSAEMRIAGNSLPDWWKHGAGQCRNTGAFSTEFFFTPGVCASPWSGSAAGGFVYEIANYGPNTARVRIQAANPFEEQIALSSGTEYYAFRVHISHSKSTGAGSCAGCADPVMLRLENVQLFQPPTANNDPILTAPLVRSTAYWQASVGAIPTITSVSPGAGAGGTPVTINGTALGAATLVLFGGVPATFTVNNPSQISATVPVDARTSPVQVVTPFGAALSGTTFIVAPQIISFVPHQGPIGSTVQLTGYNFTGTTGVTFNGVAAVFTALSDSVVEATVPAGATSGPIVITNPGGSAQTPIAFQVGPAEGLLNMSWNDCGLAGDEITTFACNTNSGPTFNLVGSFVPPAGVNELLGLTADIRVSSSQLPDWWKFGAGQCRGAGSLASNMNFQTGPFSCANFWQGLGAATTSYDVNFYGPNTARLRVTGFIPSSARGPVDPLTEYYAFRTQISRLRTVSDGACADCDRPVVLSLERIQLLQPSTVGNDPIITRPFNRSIAYWQGTPGPAPSITSITPTAGGPGTPVTIHGHNFISVASVEFQGIGATFTVPSDSVIQTSVPLSARTGAVVVRTPNGTAIGPVFTVAPRILSFSPRQAPIGHNPISIRGFNFTSASSVLFNGTSAMFTIPSDSLIQATVPAGTTNGPITVVGPGGTTVSDSTFRVGTLPPGAMNLSWDDCGLAGAEFKNFACNTNSGTSFNLVGSFVPPPFIDEFIGIGAEIRIQSFTALPNWWRHGAAQCRGTSALTPNFVFGSTPCNDPWGTGAVSAIAYDIAYYGPNSARLVIQGSKPMENRGPLSPDNQYYAFRASILPTNSTGTGSCTGCTTPVQISLQSLQLFQPAAVGFDPIIVAPLDRTVAYWQAVPGPPPTITTLTPGAGAPGAPVSVRGTGFTNVNAVRFGALNATFTVPSDSVIQANVPPNARTAPVVVETLNGTAVGPVFLVAPRILTFVPRQAPIGFNPIVIRGYNFTGATAVQFNGTAATFSVASDSVIQATVPAGTTNGPITVIGPGGTTASDSTFRVGPLPAGGLNLSWDNCGVSGMDIKSFACNANTGSTFVLIGSFVPPPFVDEFLGFTSDVRIEGQAGLPDWWKHGVGQCRGGSALTSSFNFTTSPPACSDPFAGLATGSASYSIGFYGPNTARLQVTASKPSANRGPVQPDREYYAFRVSISAAQSTGSGACAGCSTPMRLSLESMQLFQPSAIGYDPIIVAAQDRKQAYWQAIPAPLPQVLSFTPTAGAETTPVTVNGHFFTGASAVRFGGVLSGFTVASDSVISTSVPPGALTGPISVTTIQGTGSSAASFIVAPRITTFSPRQAPIGYTLRIHGVNFTSTSQVKFNGLAATFDVESDALILATVPSGATSGPIMVTNPGGSDVSDIDFTVGPLPGGFINLAWDNCGTNGVINKIFTCNNNSAPAFSLIGSFVPPGGVNELIGMTADLRIASATTLPDWWRHGATQCRGSSALSVAFNQPAGACMDPWTGDAVGSYSYEVGFGGPQNARMVIWCYADSARPVFDGDEYYAFRVNISAAKSTGSGSCAGCGIAAALTLRQIQLHQTPALKDDPLINTPLDSKIAYWQTIPGSAPQILTFTPGAGEVGTPVTLTGHRFTGATSVRFNTGEAVFTVVSDSVLTTSVPSAGRTGPIYVTTANGVGASTDAFIVAPDILGFAPAQAPVGHTITIMGVNFTATSAVLQHRAGHVRDADRRRDRRHGPRGRDRRPDSRGESRRRRRLGPDLPCRNRDQWRNQPVVERLRHVWGRDRDVRMQLEHWAQHHLRLGATRGHVAGVPRNVSNHEHLLRSDHGTELVDAWVGPLSRHHRAGDQLRFHRELRMRRFLRWSGGRRVCLRCRVHLAESLPAAGSVCDTFRQPRTADTRPGVVRVQGQYPPIEDHGHRKLQRMQRARVHRAQRDPAVPAAGARFRSPDHGSDRSQLRVVAEHHGVVRAVDSGPGLGGHRRGDAGPRAVDLANRGRGPGDRSSPRRGWGVAADRVALSRRPEPYQLRRYRRDTRRHVRLPARHSGADRGRDLRRRNSGHGAVGEPQGAGAVARDVGPLGGSAIAATVTAEWRVGELRAVRRQRPASDR